MEEMAVISNFWKDKKVFLTGHTGFKGSWLSLWLQQLGARVTGYSLGIPTTPSLFALARVKDGMESIEGDVRDYEKISRAMMKSQPEIVIHLAAQPLVRKSYQDPIETYATNVMGTVHVLQAVRKCKKVKAALVVTSDKCYENQEWLWGYREQEPMGGFDPYSNSKGCAELVVSSFRKSFFSENSPQSKRVAVASARAGNIIGGGDWAEDRLIPDVMSALKKKRPVIIRHPQAIRPWQHVLDPLGGYLMLIQKLVEEKSGYAEGWNFGPRDEDAKPVSWIVERLTKSWGSGISWQKDRGDHPHEAQYLKLDCSKARTKLGWQPHWNLEMALDKIVEWYRAYGSQQDMRAVTLRQIDAYVRGSKGF